MPDRILLKSPLPADELLFAALSGEDRLSAPFRYELTALSPDTDIDPKRLLGERVTVTAQVGAPPFPRFDGLVTDVGLTGFSLGLARYRLTLRPALWLLSLGARTRIFQDRDVVEIVQSLLASQPKLRFEWRLRDRGAYPKYDYCVQYGETDLAFVMRLLEHEGIHFFHEHREDGHVLILADDSTRAQAAPGLGELTWADDAEDATGLGDPLAVAWQARSAIRTAGHAHTDYDFERPSASLFAQASGPGDLQFPDRSLDYRYPGRHLTLARGDALVRVRHQEARAEARRAEVRVTTPGIAPGASLGTRGHPRRAENAKWLAVARRMRLWDGQYQTGQPSDARTPGEPLGGAGTGGEIWLDLQPLDTPFRPPRLTPRARMPGPQTATVVGGGSAGSGAGGGGNADIHTDRHGRVKVLFHWDRDAPGGGAQPSCWVRVSSPWAGSGWGFVQIPRIGQEVVVDFLEGDPDQPLITGRVYNGANPPPYALPANATQSGWKSRSSPGGGAANFNELRFEDKKGAEQVYLHAERNHDTVVENDESREIGRDWTEHVGHDAAQTVDHDRQEKVGNDKSVKVGRDRSVDIGNDDTEHVHANRSLTVDKDQDISVGAKQSLSVASDQATEVGGARAVKVAKDQSHDVTGEVLLKGGKRIKVEAADEIALLCGDASLVLKKDGTVEIKGKDIKIEGSGKITGKASGDMVLKGSKIHAN